MTITTPQLPLTLAEVAAYLRISTRTAYYLVSSGAIPAVKIGGQWRISVGALERHLNGEQATE